LLQATPSHIPSPIISATPSKKLSELWEAYKEQKIARGRWTVATRNKYEAAYNIFTDILGDIRLTELENEEESSKFINALKRYPKNKNKNPSFKGKPFNIDMANAKTFSPLSITSINFFLGVMSGLVAFAMKNQKRWDIGVNHFENQNLSDDRNQNEKRDEYSRKDIEGIITGLTKVRRIVKPEQFWVPLICLYSGMRQNEACQLRTEDIEDIDGIKVFHVRHNPEKHQRTKTMVSRDCPVHPTLMKLGFMTFVEKQRADKTDRLFPNLRLYEDKWNKDFQKWYGQTFKTKFAPRANTSFHSTRHSFINWFKQNTNIMETLPVLKSIVGHLENPELSAIAIAQSDITNSLYGKDYDLKRKYDLLSKLDYKVDLSVL